MAELTLKEQATSYIVRLTMASAVLPDYEQPSDAAMTLYRRWLREWDHLTVRGQYARLGSLRERVRFYEGCVARRRG